MPTGTTVSIYPIPDSTTLDPLLPSGNHYISSFAVTWENPDGTSLSSVTPVSMTITDPNIAVGDTIYLLTSTGLTAAGTATSNGTVTITFTSDPVYVIASTTLAQAPIFITSKSGHFGTKLKLIASGGSGTGALTFSVADGTATGCAITDNELTSKSAGTCIVTATKGADSTYASVSSVATTVALVVPAIPSKVTTSVAPGKSSVSSGARSALRALAKKLVAGAEVTITGYAKGNAVLARSRANAVARYLKSLVSVRVTEKTVTTSSANDVTVRTIKQ